LRERTAYCVVALVLAVAASCGSDETPAAIPVEEGETRLRSLLRERGVRVGSSGTNSMQSLRLAWAAFKEFAAVPVRPSELSDDPLSDGLLFEFGVFDFGGKWGKTFQLSFVRQLATADGDLQQVQLVAYFEPVAFDRMKSRIKVARCAEAGSCAARCTFEHTDAFVGDPCALSRTAGRPARPADRMLASASAWSFDTGGSSAKAQRTSWIRFVERSPMFREAAGTLQPLGYEVWQGSAD
jgi:hypothetical protein